MSKYHGLRLFPLSATGALQSATNDSFRNPPSYTQTNPSSPLAFVPLQKLSTPSAKNSFSYGATSKSGNPNPGASPPSSPYPGTNNPTRTPPPPPPLQQKTTLPRACHFNAASKNMESAAGGRPATRTKKLDVTTKTRTEMKAP